MLKVNSVLVIGLSLCLLSACASTASMSDKGQMVLNSEPANTPLQANEDSAVLTIVRNDSYVRQKTAKLLIDGKEIGDLENGNFLSVRVNPGSYKLKFKFEPGSAVHTNSTTLSAEAGQTYKYQLKSTSQGGVGGYYAGLVTTTFQILPATEGYLNYCCDVVAAP